MTSTRSVLILDDDAELRGLIAARLDDDAFATTQAGGVSEAMAMLRTRGKRFDALILDVDLPDGDGCDLCAGLRRDGFGMPVIMLTGADGEADVVRGFDAGASDSIAKPVRVGELLARLRAQLRTFGRSEATVFTIGPYDFRPDAKLLHEPARNRRVPLTEKETAILKTLHRAGGMAVSRQALLDDIWGHYPAANPHTLENHICRLRRKIEPGDVPCLIVTEGHTYRLAVART